MPNQSLHINYPIRYLRMHTDRDCWSAALAMILGVEMSLGPGSARLGKTGGMDASGANLWRLAWSHGLTLREPDPRDWTPDGLFDLLVKYGPLLVTGSFWVPTQRQWGGHATVISGLWGEGTSANTTLQIYDPALNPVFGGPFRKSLDDFLAVTDPYHILHNFSPPWPPVPR